MRAATLAGELAQGGGDLGAALLHGEGEGGPGELGVAGLVVGDGGEEVADGRELAVTAGAEGGQGGDGLAEAALEEGVAGEARRGRRRGGAGTGSGPGSAVLWA
jgi:hypothetical protein